MSLSQLRFFSFNKNNSKIIEIKFSYVIVIFYKFGRSPLSSVKSVKVTKLDFDKLQVINVSQINKNSIHRDLCGGGGKVCWHPIWVTNWRGPGVVEESLSLSSFWKFFLLFFA